MQAYHVTEYSRQARFTPAEVSKPTLKPGHVIIKVKATSINPVDHKILIGDQGINPDLPAILHMDVAGAVTEVGADVEAFSPGDEVYGCAGGLKGAAGNIDGALADYMLADASLIAHKPNSLDFTEAAALPLVSITAWEGLFDRAQIKPQDRTLIHGGAGGVGHIAIQLAKQHGAHVTATVSSENKGEIAAGLGADDIVNYRDESIEDYVARLTRGKGFDVVFDTVGGATLDASFQAAGANAQVISIIGMNTHDLTPMHAKGLSLHLVFMLLPMLTGEHRSHHGYILREIAGLVDSGKLKPLIHEERFTFEQINEAHALYASGKHIGKIVIENSS